MDTSKNITIVIASVLKPIDDVRMYYKFARSLAETNKYNIKIIGYPSNNPPDDKEIQFLPLKRFKRIGLDRLLQPLIIAKKCIELKPKVIMVNTPELLVVMYLIRILFGTKIIYDVLENTRRNIIWSHDSGYLAKVYGLLQILAERISPIFVNQYFLAEKCYQQECQYIPKQLSVVLENKASTKVLPIGLEPVKLCNTDVLRLLYSGTVAKSYGIWDAINLNRKLNQRGITTHLTIIGHCPDNILLHDLRSLVDSQIDLQISTDPIPYPEILKAMLAQDFLLIPYIPNPSSLNCIPTKVYESLAYRIPMLAKLDSPWNSIIKQFNAGFTLNYNNPDTNKVNDQMKMKFFVNVSPVMWEDYEEQVLKNTIQNLA